MLSDRLKRKKNRIVRRRQASAPAEVAVPLDDEPVALTKVTCEGFTVWCDGYRVSGSMLVYLSIFGVQTAVRAMWARLASKDRRFVQIGAEHVSLGDERYAMIRSPLEQQYLHVVLMHPDATTLINPFAKGFFVVSEHPEVQFWTRFNRMCQVPVRQSWRDEVWKLGIEKNLITVLDGIGPHLGYFINVTAELIGGWSQVIREAIEKGRLK